MTKKLPGRLETARQKFVEKGVPHPLVALYAAPGNTVSDLRAAFSLSAGKTRMGAGDFRAGLATEAAALGGLGA